MSESAPAPYAGPQRVFSGMQPTNGLHLGNYLGALVKFVALQEQFSECMYCVVDLHAITENLPPDLKANTREVAATYLAAGVDPKRSIIFVQSAVPAHAELGWILQCVARMGWLERMTQFKDKSAGKNAERISAGLFTYPVLMAADILAYKATHVPVGDDQKQHLELARDIAQKFNNDFAAPNFFPQPEPLIQGPGARIMSLRDGSKKMSKSDPSDQSRINLTDDADAIANKLKRATTDPLPLPETEEGLKGRAEVENLVGIYAAMAGTSVAAVLGEWGGKGFGAFKPALADLVVARLAPIAGEVRQMLADPAQLDAILAEGAEKARALAAPVLQDVRRLVGFWG